MTVRDGAMVSAGPLRPGLAALRDAPRAALLPGLGGLLPFLLGALALWFVDGPMRSSLEWSVLTYAALILSFIGAIHWGLALLCGNGRAARFGFGWSVVPALWGWLALAVGFVPALAMLGLGFIAQLAVDFRVSAVLSLPSWYLALRSVLTSVVLLSLLLASLATAMRA